jgi:putative peptidoglycan binding protein
MSTGQQILDLAAPHVGEAYLFGAVVAKDNPNWHGPWDCAEFASWCVYQAAGTLYGCSNDKAKPSLADAYTGYWARDAKDLGQRITVAVAARTPGAAVLRVPVAGQVIGHIVISDGQGGTVEAHSTNRGVIRDILDGRRWDMGVLVPGIDYSRSPEPRKVTPPALVYRLMSPRMKGPVVLSIQTGLKAKGFDPGLLDGVFGGQTFAAVRAFQLTNGLVPDGEVGAHTAAALGITI